MNLAFSEEQEMLRKAARDFLEDKCSKKLVKQLEESEKGYSPELWQEIADLGYASEHGKAYASVFHKPYAAPVHRGALHTCSCSPQRQSEQWW